MPPELAPLLAYLKVSYDQFSVVEDKYFARLGELLTYHNIIPAGTVVNRSNFSDWVKAFQNTVMGSANPDGIPGEDTLWAMQQDWAPTRGLKLVNRGVPNDPFPGAIYPFTLRSDVAALYLDFYNEVHDNAGVITSSGSIRDLSVVAGPGQSATSMHYTGIALDVYTNSGMTKLAADAYIVERVGSRRWQVWNKVAAPNGSARQMNAVIYNTNTKSTSMQAVNASVIDFTAIAAKHGFANIGSRGCFPAQYICAEWWHFQCEQVLVPYISQFGAELLTIYSAAKLTANAPIWQARKKIYKRDWN